MRLAASLCLATLITLAGIALAGCGGGGGGGGGSKPSGGPAAQDVSGLTVTEYYDTAKTRKYGEGQAVADPANPGQAKLPIVKAGNWLYYWNDASNDIVKKQVKYKADGTEESWTLYNYNNGPDRTAPDALVNKGLPYGTGAATKNVRVGSIQDTSSDG